MSSTKIIIASEARYINKYKNLKSKVTKCCAEIYFNRQCLKIVVTEGVHFYFILILCVKVLPRSGNINDLRNVITIWEEVKCRQV